MNRRQFISTAGLGTGFTLFAKVDGAIGATTKEHAEISRGFAEVAPPHAEGRALSPEANMTLVKLTCDVFVAGGGMAGVIAALSAARHGAKVVLVQDRSRLGGNASSEVKMHIVGANSHGGRPGWREGGVIEELRLDDAVNNPHRSWELWDLLLYDKVKSEPNITLLLDSVLYAATTQNNLIQKVQVRCDKTEHLYEVTAKQFMDCTGDCRLGIEAGAEYRTGREGKADTGEPLALDKADNNTLGSSILFTSRDYGRPVPYKAPAWAHKITQEQLFQRGIGNSWEYGYWWIEWGGGKDTIRDNEEIRFELLAIVMGIWDYIKNSGKYPSAANWGMDWVGMIPGKRGSRRLVGEHVLNQMDLEGGWRQFDDGVAIGGWNLDDHPPGGFHDTHLSPFRSIRLPSPYNIPLRSLYSKNIGNLWMAGRNISATHVAFTSARVMATCSCIGQAAGTAAALCVRDGVLPRDVYRDKPRLKELQNLLLRDDQTIIDQRNQDAADIARVARVDYSDILTECDSENVINGFVRDEPGSWSNRWGAKMTDQGAWLELSWGDEQLLRKVQITFDTGFQRELTLTSSDTHNSHMIRAAQPECVRDYQLIARDASGREHVLADVRANHQRLRRHEFNPVKARALRLKITATNGSDTARVFEVRCYA